MRVHVATETAAAAEEEVVRFSMSLGQHGVSVRS